MSSERVEVVRALSEAWNAGERSVRDLARLLDPEVEAKERGSTSVGCAIEGSRRVRRPRVRDETSPGSPVGTKVVRDHEIRDMRTIELAQALTPESRRSIERLSLRS